MNRGLVEVAGSTGFSGGIRIEIGKVSNSGTILSPGPGVSMESGSFSNSGSISVMGSGDTSFGLNMFDGGFASNAGDISGYSFGILLGFRTTHDPVGEGHVVNSGTITAVGSLGTGIGIYLSHGGVLTVSNTGVVIGDNGITGAGIVTNLGTVESTGEFYRSGVRGGTITNGSKNDTTALIQAVWDGVDSRKLTNFGTIESTGTMSGAIFGGTGEAVNSDEVVNRGLIEATGSFGAIDAESITNFGTVHSSNAYGLSVFGDGRVTNSASGLILGDIGIFVTGGATVVNAGTIESTGAPGVAIMFPSGGVDRLIVDPGAVFGGTVLGPGGAGTIELADGPQPGTLSGIGTSFQSFGTIEVDSSAVWTLSGDTTGARLVNDGTVRVTGTQALVFGSVAEDKGKHGAIALAAGDAEFQAAVEAGQSLVFRDGAGVLKLDDPSQFAAAIKGFRKGDVIELVATAANSVSFSKHKLAVFDGGTKIATLLLKGRYNARDFTVTEVGGNAEIATSKAGTGPPIFLDTSGLCGTTPGDHLARFGGAGGVAGAGGDPLLSWAADPFHFWTIPG